MADPRTLPLFRITVERLDAEPQETLYAPIVLEVRMVDAARTPIQSRSIDFLNRRVSLDLRSEYIELSLKRIGL